MLRAVGAASLVAGVALGALGLGLGVWVLFTRRASPEERERGRRLKVSAEGRLADAIVLELRDGVAYYTYTVRGAEYTASQDIRSMSERLPAGLTTPSHAGVKYLPGNPANSIVLSEDWSGLYAPQPTAPPSRPETAA